MTLKKCNSCGVEKLLAEYNKNKKSKDGHLGICKMCRKQPCREYYQNNKVKANETKKKCRHKKRDQYVQKQRERRERLKEQLNEQNRIRRATDPQFRLRENMSRRMNHALKTRFLTKNRTSWIDLVGYTLEQLKEHLEKQFTPEMSWENHGTYWHIDHIRPDSWFNYDSTDSSEFKACWALENLQPLPAFDNLKKNNRWEG